MQSPTIRYNKEEFMISRHNPPDFELAGRIVRTLSATIKSTEDQLNNKERIEHDLKEHFKSYGKIINGKWLNEHEIILLFEQ